MFSKIQYQLSKQSALVVASHVFATPAKQSAPSGKILNWTRQVASPFLLVPFTSMSIHVVGGQLDGKVARVTLLPLLQRSYQRVAHFALTPPMVPREPGIVHLSTFISTAVLWLYRRRSSIWNAYANIAPQIWNIVNKNRGKPFESHTFWWKTGVVCWAGTWHGTTCVRPSYLSDSGDLYWSLESRILFNTRPCILKGVVLCIVMQIIKNHGVI